jgi:glutaredoxin
LQFIEKKASTEWRSFPIIFDDTRFIGGFIDLKGYLDKEKTLDFTSDF